MKVIVSHDVDHLTPLEHIKDGFLVKHILRSILELFKRKIGLKEFFFRIKELFTNKWQYIEELIDFNSRSSVPSTFFIGVKNGNGLSYSFEKANSWANRIHDKKCAVGIHGIEANDIQEVQEEFSIFKSILKQKDTGIRMHYLNLKENSLQNLASQGYQYDSSVFEFKNPYKIDEMWEFPVQIMDNRVMENGKKYQSVDLQKAQKITLEKIAQAKTEGLQFLNIIFHDRYFNEGFNAWKSWYMWLIDYLKKEGYQFCDFQQAIEELER